MSEFVLEIMRMADDELIDYIVGLSEARAVELGKNSIIWEEVDKYTDKIETVRAELLRRM